MTPKQLEEARATIEDNPVVITVVDRTGNTNSIKKELMDNKNLNEIQNQNETKKIN